jgi:hypothetical protein
MAKLRTLTLFALVFGFVGLAGADTLQMEGTKPSMDSARPTRGMTQASVQSRYGTPVSRQAAVGEPPISRWDYQGFVVYFEHDRVIHTVAKR